VRRDGPYEDQFPYELLGREFRWKFQWIPSKSRLQFKLEKTNFPLDNCQQGGNGQNFNRNEPSLRDIIKDQVKIKTDFGKRFEAIDKLLENLGAKKDSFAVAMQNQPSFNKML
jgi:hypothetical protein